MKKLLIVDDEADVREFAANFFRKRKIDVTTAASGEEALELLSKQKPDLMLLDIKMTGLDGIQTLQQLRDQGNQTKVIMVTGKKPEEGDASAKCTQLGAVNYIHKPLDLGELEQIVLKELK